MERSPRAGTGRVLSRINFSVVLFIIVLVTVPYGTVDAWSEALFESAIFGLTILWIVDGWVTQSKWVKPHRLLLPLFALVALALLQSLPVWSSAGGPVLAGASVYRAASLDPFESWRFALKLLAIALALGLLLNYVSSFSRVRTLAYVVVGVALASALLGFLLHESPQLTWLLTGGRLAPGRSYAQFENRNHFAFLMEMGIGLVLGLAFGQLSVAKRFVLCLLGLALWGSVLLTHSRGGVVSVAAETVFFLLLFSSYRFVLVGRNGQQVGVRQRSFGRSMSRLGLAALLLAVVCGSVIMIGGSETINRFEETPAEFTARETAPLKTLRPQIWRATVTMIRDNPLIGVGFAAYSVAIPRYLDASGKQPLNQAHNDYLELLASGGVVGGILGAWFLVIFVKQVKTEGQPDRDQWALKCGALAGLFAVAVHSLFDFGLHVTINALVGVTLIVIAVRSRDDEGVTSSTYSFAGA
jgi:O-antigen ligase